MHSVTYLDTRGRPQALERILAAGGARAARMRLWVHPIEGVYDLQYNLQLARRVQDAGMAVYLDFHYSDTWADPQRASRA
jgi:arabinogalactan endo-1,4-beta-galactosidase